MTRARVCPSCRRLNSASDDECFHCGQRLVGPSRRAGEPSRLFAAPLAATKFLAGLCVVNFAMLVLIDGSLPIGLFGPPASHEAVLGVGGMAGALGFLQPWRLLSANFVHLSLLHLAMNLYALMSFGRSFEERYGGARLILVYAITGICGFALSTWWYGPYGPRTAGASASLFGLIGVEIAVLALRRDPMAREAFFQYLFMAVALAIIMPVNNFAHLGGFVAGVASGGMLHRIRATSDQGKLMIVLALLVTAASLLSVLLSLLSLFVWRQAVS